MKNEQQQEAMNLYFQTGMSKTAIAETLGVNRRTILLWCKQGNWDRLRDAGRHMPALVAEKCYHMLDSFMSRKLQDTAFNPITIKDAQVIHLLASSVKKLRNRCTLNESMELFNYFLEGLQRRNPTLATEVRPEMEEYMAVRARHEITDFLPDDINTNDSPKDAQKEKEEAEEQADRQDLWALQQEVEDTGDYDQALEKWQQNTTTTNTPAFNSPQPRSTAEASAKHSQPEHKYNQVNQKNQKNHSSDGIKV